MVCSATPKGVQLVASMKDHHTSVSGLDWGTVRRWKRCRVDVRLKITYWRDNVKTVVFGQGSDVSEGGIAGYIPAELEPGENVEIEMALPYGRTKEPLTMKAVIRNRNGFRYGLEYVLVTESVREALLRSLKAMELVQE